MDIKTEQRAYRESRPSALGRGIERLTSPVGKKLAKLVPSSLVRMVLKRLDDASGAAQLYNFEHNRSNLAACRKAAGNVEKVAMSINASTGAASGFGGLFTMGLDVPATVGLAMRNIRDTGRAYGFTGEGEAEQIFRLQILELATLDNEEQRRARIAALEAGIAPDGGLLAPGAKASTPVVDQVVERVSRALALASFRRRAGMVVPFVGAAVGGAINASFQRDVSKAARFAYQARRLQAEDV
ncbi:EcsC family protein [Novosphingopyxis iocasae]|uniref:EcsC family protein n=1 Tax=Novosphingopyxis iocasae TaxID=2762729 RepID=UPI0016515B45|nr:EcsC family protein [Novosphingopyxis iocasae]